MTISIEPLSANFAARVQGIDLAQPVSSEDVAAIHGGMAHFAVLAFPDQRIGDEQQLAFTKISARSRMLEEVISERRMSFGLVAA